jgi:hypothetical protein
MSVMQSKSRYNQNRSFGRRGVCFLDSGDQLRAVRPDSASGLFDPGKIHHLAQRIRVIQNPIADLRNVANLESKLLVVLS